MLLPVHALRFAAGPSTLPDNWPHFLPTCSLHRLHYYIQATLFSSRPPPTPDLHPRTDNLIFMVNAGASSRPPAPEHPEAHTPACFCRHPRGRDPPSQVKVPSHGTWAHFLIPSQGPRSVTCPHHHPARTPTSISLPFIQVVVLQQNKCTPHSPPDTVPDKPQ